MNIQLECTYCGNKWEKTFIYNAEVEAATCFVCGDGTLKIRDLAKSKIDYYQGSPPFPEKKAELEPRESVNEDDVWGYF